MEKDYTEITNKLENILMAFDGKPDDSEPDKDSMMMKVTEIKPPTYDGTFAKERDMEEPEPVTETERMFRGWEADRYTCILKKPNRS